MADSASPPATQHIGGADENSDTGPWAVARYMASVNPVMLSTGMRIIETYEGYAELAMHIGPEYGNTYGVCHGGIVFSLADMCFGLAANSYNERCVTASAEIHYIAPGNVNADMTAVAKEVWRGPRASLYDVHVRNADGATAAHVRVRGRILGGPVIPPPGSEKPEQLA
ncbi:MAG: hotdog fold thioesterase [Pseudomonadota bacterium]